MSDCEPKTYGAMQVYDSRDPGSRDRATAVALAQLGRWLIEGLPADRDVLVRLRHEPDEPFVPTSLKNLLPPEQSPRWMVRIAVEATPFLVEKRSHMRIFTFEEMPTLRLFKPAARELLDRAKRRLAFWRRWR